MGLRTTLASLVLIAPAAFAGTVGEAAVSAEDLLPPRPSIEEYVDQTAFVADVLQWERQRDELAERLAAGEIRLHRQETDGGDWHHVTGPEDLDTALNNARGYVQPRYREQYRFNRTTHISFPLEHLEAEEMAHKVVEAGAPATPGPSDAEQLPERVLEQLQLFQEVTPEPEPPSFPLEQVSLRP